LGISTRSLERLVKARSHVRLGSRVVFPRAPLSAWLAAQAEASMTEVRAAV
jgi:hypothetical protein